MLPPAPKSMNDGKESGGENYEGGGAVGGVLRGRGGDVQVTDDTSFRGRLTGVAAEGGGAMSMCVKWIMIGNLSHMREDGRLEI